MATPTTFPLLLLLTACGLGPDAASKPDSNQPPVEVGEDQHFCCQSIDFDSKTGSGEGCVTIAKEQINQCNNVLYCEGRWHKQDGDVKCL